jgi:hypothetical protein
MTPRPGVRSDTWSRENSEGRTKVCVETPEILNTSSTLTVAIRRRLATVPDCQGSGLLHLMGLVHLKDYAPWVRVPQSLVCGPVGLASPIDLMRPACERAVGTCCVTQLVSGIYAPSSRRFEGLRCGPAPARRCMRSSRCPFPSCFPACWARPPLAAVVVEPDLGPPTPTRSSRASDQRPGLCRPRHRHQAARTSIVILVLPRRPSG